MSEECRVSGCRCPCHTRTVSEEQRAGALLAYRDVGVPLLMALEWLGYDLPPDVREKLEDGDA